MRDFLLTTMPMFLWVFMAFHLIFFVLLRRRFMDTKNIMFLLTAAVSFVLWFDSLTLAFGTFMDAGSLASVNRFGLVTHNALLPLIFLLCVYILNLNPIVRRIVSIFTVILMVAGIVAGIRTPLEAQEIAGIVHYSAAQSTPTWITTINDVLSYGLIAALMLAGLVAQTKQKTMTVMLAGDFMLLSTIIGPITGNSDLSFFFVMIGEIFMILFLYAYAENRFYKEFMEANS